MNTAAFQELQTPRLTLRRFRMEDAAFFFERLAGSEAVTRHMLWQTHRTLPESEESIRKVLRRYDSAVPYTWAVACKGSGELIGRIDLLKFEETRNECSFAYMLAEEYWGRGYAAEALSAVLAFAFEALQIDRVTAEHFAENPASGGAMRKAGMVCTGVTAGAYEKNGVCHDAVSYTITRDMWLQLGEKE